MSDFLTRLAQRSIGAAQLIAPRLPSMFAPAEEPNNNASSMANVIAAPRHTPLASLPMQSRTTAHTDSISPDARTAIHSHRSPAPEPTSAPEPATRNDASQPRTATKSIPLVERAMQANIQAAPPLASADAPASIAPLEAPATTRKPNAPADAPEPWQPLLPQRAAKSATPFSAAPDIHHDASAEANHATPPAPTVHITIGRVEVKANVATPPAAPRPRVESKPALSLNDYLKRGANAS